MGSMKRKTNKAKRVDRSCRNHGSCNYCKGNRLHNSEKRLAETDAQMIDMGIVNGVRLTYFGGNVFATPVKIGRND